MALTINPSRSLIHFSPVKHFITRISSSSISVRQIDDYRVVSKKFLCGLFKQLSRMDGSKAFD